MHWSECKIEISVINIFYYSCMQYRCLCCHYKTVCLAAGRYLYVWVELNENREDK